LGRAGIRNVTRSQKIYHEEIRLHQNHWKDDLYSMTHKL